jgi:hypothetical protein
MDVAVFGALIASGVALRLVCHELPNFAPVAAMALFAGFFFRSRTVAVAVPLCVMAISDWFLGAYHPAIMVLVYGTLALPVLCSSWLRKAFDLRDEQRIAPVLGLLSCGLVSSVMFFLITNFGVWCWFGTYDRSWAGLWHCYVAALPFFRYTLAGDVFFSVVLFGGYAWALSVGRARSLALQVR